MSGIAGIVRFDGTAVTTESVKSMLDAMPHRGPDGSHVAVDGHVGFGHNMLFTTPESLYERLPMRSSSGTVLLTSDARIDNRDELIAELDMQLSADRPITDADVILASYEKWGKDCAAKFLGDYSVAIWDSAKNELVCFRDIIGLKPLYYFHSDAFIAFATEVKALLAVPGMPNRLNEVRLGDYLMEFRLDQEITIYEEILRVPPGHTMEVTAAHKRLARYAEFTPDPSVASMTEDQYVPRFRELMKEAVRCRVRSAFPVASQLSGGLDSSYITCLARDILKEQGDRLQTISMIFDEIPEPDEREFIQLVLDEGDIDPIFLHADKFGPLTDLDEIHDYVDDGYCSGNHHLVWRMLRLAREKGQRIVLDGIDGDSTVDHGLGIFQELASQCNWQRFSEEVRKSVEQHAGATHKQHFVTLLGSAELILKWAALPQLEEFARRGQLFRFVQSARFLRREYGLRYRWIFSKNWYRMLIPHLFWNRREVRKKRDEPLPDIIAPEFGQRLHLADRRNAFSDFTPEVRSVRETHLNYFRSDFAVNEHETTEHYAAAHQIEPRHPFMDRRLIEFCLALPTSQSFSEGWSRYIMRKAMETIVPDAIVWRTGKGDMTSNFVNGLFHIDRGLFGKHAEDIGVLENYVDQKVLGTFVESHESLLTKERMILAKTVALSLWFKKRFTTENLPPFQIQ